jgi:excisionase family DNA binding protein
MTMKKEEAPLNQPLSRFVDINFATNYLGLSKSAVYQLVCHKRLISFKSGKYLRFLEQDLQDFILNSRTKQPPK